MTARDRPDLEAEVRTAFRERWPEFIFHDQIAKPLMQRVGEYFGDFDVLLLDEGKVAAGGWGVPFGWDGTLADLPTGYDATLARAVHGHEAGEPATAFSFMAAAVTAGYDRQGLARQVLTSLTARALGQGLSRVVAPLRPTWKHRYPTVSMADYATWVGPDGLSIDPWIRTHQRMGAAVLGPASESMRIEGTVAEWESWAAMVFPASGDYVVPAALGLVHIDRRADLGVYVEENLWVEHPVSRGPAS